MPAAVRSPKPSSHTCAAGFTPAYPALPITTDHSIRTSNTPIHMTGYIITLIVVYLVIGFLMVNPWRDDDRKLPRMIFDAIFWIPVLLYLPAAFYLRRWLGKKG